MNYGKSLFEFNLNDMNLNQIINYLQFIKFPNYFVAQSVQGELYSPGMVQFAYRFALNVDTLVLSRFGTKSRVPSLDHTVS